MARQIKGDRRTVRSDNRMEWELLAGILKELRAETDISARQLSLRLGRAEDFIFKVEKGIQYPDFLVVLDIVKILGGDPTEVVQQIAAASEKPKE